MPVRRTLFHVNPTDPTLSEATAVKEIAASKGIPPGDIVIVRTVKAAVAFLKNAGSGQYALFLGLIGIRTTRRLEGIVGPPNCSLNGLNCGRLYNYQVLLP